MANIAGELHDGVRYEFIPDPPEVPEQITGEIHLSPAIPLDGVDTKEFVEILEIEEEPGVIRIRLTDDGGTTENVELTYNGHTSYLPLLSAPVFYAVSLLGAGDTEVAERVIEETYPDGRMHWPFRNDCRDTLTFDALLDVLNTLSGQSEAFSHVQFRSGLGYFAKRILDSKPSAIESFEVLRNRVQQWNEAENMMEVELSEVIGEKLGRDYYRMGLDDERTALLEIGFDPSTYDPEWRTTVPATWIAHTVLTEGIEAARDFVRSQPSPVEEDYGSVKEEAFEADRGNRGRQWGSVVALSPNSGEDDFRFDVFNYLKWTGKEYRGKAKFPPMLYAGAHEVAPPELPSFLLQQVEFREQITTGHAWRRDNAVEREEDAFSNAREIAEGSANPRYEFNPGFVVEAEASLAHAQAKRIDQEATEADSIDRYEETITEIQRLADEHEIKSWVVERNLDFLRDRKAGYQS